MVRPEPHVTVYRQESSHPCHVDECTSYVKGLYAREVKGQVECQQGSKTRMINPPLAAIHDKVKLAPPIVLFGDSDISHWIDFQPAYFETSKSKYPIINVGVP